MKVTISQIYFHNDMTPFQIFKLTQNVMGRKYHGKLEDFESSSYRNYFVSLVNVLSYKISKDNHIQRKYIQYCSQKFGNSFSPFQLDSEEYIESFQAWWSSNRDYESYKNEIAKNIKFIGDFCKKECIFNLNDYAQQWGTTHFISNQLNENVAFFIGLHKINMTTPEKKILRKGFLNKVSLIKERIQREPEFRKFLERSVSILKDKLETYKARSQTN